MGKANSGVSSTVTRFVMLLMIKILFPRKIGISLLKMQFTMAWIGFVLPTIKDFMKCWLKIMVTLQLSSQLERSFLVWTPATCRLLFMTSPMKRSTLLMVKKPRTTKISMPIWDHSLVWTSKKCSPIKTFDDSNHYYLRVFAMRVL